MKYILIAFLATFIFFVPITFASELPYEPYETESFETQAFESDPSESEPFTSVSEEVVRSVSPVSPSNTTGLKKILLQMFGNYDTVVTEHRYTNSNGYSSVSVDVQEDYPWIASALIFSLVLWCSLRILGGIICGKR